MYYVYILKSTVRNWHYIGSTSNIAGRLAKHNGGKVKSTKPYRPLQLAYQEVFATHKEARARESFLKRTARARNDIFEKVSMAPSSSG